MDRRLLFLLFAAASLLAVLAGCWTAHTAGVPAGVWGRMIGAWAVGLGIAIALTRTGGRWRQRAGAGALAAIVLLLVLVFADGGLEGVHRWIVIGPVRLNVAALMLPLAIVLLADRQAAPVAMLVMMVLLVAQPDASQACGLAVAAVILLARHEPRRPGIWAIAAIVALAIVSWWRPDPLHSVAEVEGIVALAWGQSPALAIVALVALAAASIAPITAGRDPAALALAAYMIVTAAMPALGAFPVPLIGMSMSPIIGWWLGIGTLAGRRRPQ